MKRDLKVIVFEGRYEWRKADGTLGRGESGRIL